MLDIINSPECCVLITGAAAATICAYFAICIWFKEIFKTIL